MAKPVSLPEELLSPFAWDRYLQQLEFDYYNVTATQQWAVTMWPWIFASSFLYVTLCFLGVRYMKDRERFRLRRTLVLWNAGLAAYSVYALSRMIPGFVLDVKEGRWSHMICSSQYFYDIGPWSFLFPLSKVFEFGDTVFVVLKKKKLIFLHWYHHITVLWFCWYSLVYPIGPGRMFSTVNLFVHSVMYTYYGIVASGLVRLPRSVNICVTTLQLAQMFIGLYVNVYAYYKVYTGGACDMHVSHFVLSTTMYLSYMILFANYFYMTYINKRPAVPVSSEKKNGLSDVADAALSNGSSGHAANGRNGINANGHHATTVHHVKAE
eukprot:scpid72518/ scgid19823/ Elongation of very long chain fatty acids protein 6; 3-keto acyl-CoA synthase elovl6; ELOVL fatty acid elongase 6